MPDRMRAGETRMEAFPRVKAKGGRSQGGAGGALPPGLCPPLRVRGLSETSGLVAGGVGCSCGFQRYSGWHRETQERAVRDQRPPGTLRWEWVRDGGFQKSPQPQELPWSLRRHVWLSPAVTSCKSPGRQHSSFD